MQDVGNLQDSDQTAQRDNGGASFIARLANPFFIGWLAVVFAAIVLISLGKKEVPWAFQVPREIRWNFKGQISQLMDWLVNEASFGLFSFYELTRGLAWLMEIPLELATSILSTGFLKGQGSDAIQLTPSLSWIAIIVLVVCLGRYARDWKLAALAGGCFLYLAVFAQWESAMTTLSSIIIAVPLGVAAGLFLGILAYRWRWMELIITPLLDLMQTVPIFAYLVPILVLFGFGPVAAMIATIIYAMPPMVRVTVLALRQVPSEIKDLGNMTGCTGLQMLFKVLIPSAKPSLMVGVNQVIMLSLNMVIIASMIGAGGLGYDVLAALRRLDIGTGIEAGVGIVVLAIALDRLSQAMAKKAEPVHSERQNLSWPRRHPYLFVSLVVLILTFSLSFTSALVERYPESWTITTGAFWADIVKFININYFDQLESFKTFFLLNVLVPIKRFLLALPWPIVVLGVGLAGWQLGGRRLALLTALLALFIAVVGLWDKAMVTVYLCGISVILASLIGIPIGILAAERPAFGRVIEVLIDTLQTLPSFVYLMPVVMLFRVGDFAAMIAVVAYALAPAVRYTMHGIRQVDPQLIEAGCVSGCTPLQLLTKIKLRLALPEIMLGINQTIMLALSMLVITALVGTRELGQEVYIALTKADTGRGIVAGLCVAFIAIIADRLITAGAKRAKQRLGLS
ncbi:MAG: ABC transporter permease subunit [Kiloniellales bacterium]|nr:ABC transporter permease subunit [Kiloniellales bacterium]